jgi:anti-sigma factor RsiW
MTHSSNMDELMMNALDGALSAEQRRTLNEYLDQHPQERALFERMQGVDTLLRAERVTAPPPGLKYHVMAAVPRQRIEPATLRWPQIVFIILAASLLASIIAVILFVVFSTLQPLLPQSVLPALVSILSSIIEFGVSIFSVVIAIGRAALAQPVTWLVMCVAMSIVALWMRIVLGVILPGLRAALA